MVGSLNVLPLLLMYMTDSITSIDLRVVDRFYQVGKFGSTEPVNNDCKIMV